MAAKQKQRPWKCQVKEQNCAAETTRHPAVRKPGLQSRYMRDLLRVTAHAASKCVCVCVHVKFATEALHLCRFFESHSFHTSSQRNLENGSFNEQMSLELHN